MASLPLSGSQSSANAVELREAFAIANQERNLIRVERDVLSKEKWLVVFYALVMTAFTAWLGHLLLRRSSLFKGPQQRVPLLTAESPVQSREATTVRMTPRRNATITIRNSETQQPEVIAQVATRRLFSSPTTTRIKPVLMKPALAEQLGSFIEPRPAIETEIEDAYAPTISLAPKIATAVVATREPRKPATRPTFRVDPYPDYYGSEQVSHYETVFRRKLA